MTDCGWCETCGNWRVLSEVCVGCGDLEVTEDDERYIDLSADEDPRHFEPVDVGR